MFGGDRTVPEIDITDYPAFFEELRTAEKLPTTSQPSVGDFTEVYEPLLADGGEVVSVHISGGLSGTPEAARQAKEALTRDGRGGERIEVVDSTTAAGGLGFMVLAAAQGRARRRRARRRWPTHVAAARSELRLWFAIDTLEFLRRGGRIGAASAWIGSTLKVKPILTVENEMTPVERVRTSSRAFERLVEYARSCADSGADAWSAQHINAPDQCARLVERCTEIYGHEPTIVSEIGPVLVGAHRAGPARHGRRAQQLRGLAATGGAPDGANTALMLSVRDIVRIVLTVVCVVVTLYLLWVLRKPIGWLLIAIFLATALSPPGELPQQEHEARLRDHDHLPRPAARPDPADLADRPAADQRGEQLRGSRAAVRATTSRTTSRRTGRCASSNEDYDITAKLQKEAGKLPSRLGGAAGTLRDIGLGIVNSLFALLTILVHDRVPLGSGRAMDRADHPLASTGTARAAAALARQHRLGGERLRGRRARDRLHRRGRRRSSCSRSSAFPSRARWRSWPASPR